MESTFPTLRNNATAIILGVGVIVTRGDCVVLGRRLSPQPCWTLPGGKIEPSETVEECAQRELYEETGLRGAGKIDYQSVANLRAPGFHAVTFGVRFPDCVGELKLNEPEKFSAWEWFPISRLPEDLFFPARLVLDRFLNRPGDYPGPSGLCWFSDVGCATGTASLFMPR